MRLLFTVLFAIILLSCNSKEPECPKSKMCPAVVITISAYLTHQDGKPYALDSFYSFFSNNVILIHSKDLTSYAMEEMRKRGRYYVAGDQMVELTTKAGRHVHFVGYKNGKRVVTETFVIGHDCCNVKLIGGNNQIVVH